MNPSPDLETGREFFNAACGALDAFDLVSSHCLRSGLLYGASQLVLTPRGKQVYRNIKRELKKRNIDWT
jgi:hypothetical protein